MKVIISSTKTQIHTFEEHEQICDGIYKDPIRTGDLFLIREENNLGY